ncbi:YsnF/AvaK domain-containing protein [Sporosarcina sp. ANT_H38]|uniref:YsnF/AvaK domain-containing protein n=1 Tax=Sporosarcina sp. ANT_H38 TaxID=2597358 RepID=UPI0011F3855C|nr:YsnF/AvaK domain-containing protein [Sporosarcina sp. ANT_H38]KAA0955506.1 YsnF/AvaK domain-containing protein [Sporosarcina sp. ANT_H38]
MADKKYVGTFQNETEVLNKIYELKTQGYSDNDIYIVTNDTDKLSIVRGETDVDLRTPKGNLKDKFIAFLTGDESVKGEFTNMGFTEEESNRYFNEVKAGGILLYVDPEYGNLYENTGTEHQAGYTDPNIGSNLVVDNYDNMNIAMDAEREERLQLHEEKLKVDKERYQAGEVNVTKHVVEDTQTVEVPVTREEVYIERRAVTEETAAGEVFDDGENIHIPVMEERIEVTKRPVVKEEIIVGKREVHDTETVSERVRREEADIDRTDDVLNAQERAAIDPLEPNRFERNELKDTPSSNRNRF